MFSVQEIAFNKADMYIHSMSGSMSCRFCQAWRSNASKFFLLNFIENSFVLDSNGRYQLPSVDVQTKVFGYEDKLGLHGSVPVVQGITLVFATYDCGRPGYGHDDHWQQDRIQNPPASFCRLYSKSRLQKIYCRSLTQKSVSCLPTFKKLNP
jgi:hypothetical protein